MKELLGSYSITRLTIEEYKVTFEIPNNCTYKVIHNDGIYIVFIELMEDETQPSQPFNTFSFLTQAFAGSIHVEFNQKIGLDGLASANKPRIRISVNE